MGLSISPPESFLINMLPPFLLALAAPPAPAKGTIILAVSNHDDWKLFPVIMIVLADFWELPVFGKILPVILLLAREEISSSISYRDSRDSRGRDSRCAASRLT